MNRILKQILLFLSGLIFLIGCTHEEVKECTSGIRLNFEFLVHTDQGNRFAEDVQVVKVYLFDSNDLLCKIQSESGAVLKNDYIMTIDVPPGKYTIIAWGGSHTDFNNSFHEGHMNDPVTHDYVRGVTEGKTTLEDFRIFLNYNLADDYPEDAVPAIDHFDDLFYGAVGEKPLNSPKFIMERVEVKSGMIENRKVQMIRNTNVFKVMITGLKYFNNNIDLLKSEKLNVWASARNARFRYDNSIGEYARMVRYTPFFTQTDSDTLFVDIKTLRLDMIRHTADPVFLQFEEISSGAVYPDKPLDILNLLLQARNPETGEYIYQTQEDLDRIYEHPVRIDVSADLHMRIYIHDWEVIDLIPDLGI